MIVLWWCVGAADAKKPKAPEAPPVEVVAPSGPVRVVSGAELAGVQGAAATVVGTLKRLPVEGELVTALVLAYGAVVVVAGEPPSGWDWMLDTRIQVRGTLWGKGKPEGPERPTVEPTEPPMPADGMPGF